MLHSAGAHVYIPLQIDVRENVGPSQPEGAILLVSSNGHHASDSKGLEIHAWKGVAHLDIKPLNILATPA